MARGIKVLAWVFGGLLTLIILAGLFLAFLFDWNWLRGPLAARAGGALGRAAAIEGDLSAELGRVTHIRAERIRLGNPPWATPSDMARIAAIELDIRLLPLLAGRIELPQLHIIRPVVTLEKSRSGEANWQFNRAAKAAAPERRTTFPIIEHLTVESGQLNYRDPNAGIDIQSRIATATGGDPAHERVHLSGTGSFKDQPARLELEAGSLLTLRDPSRPYPLRLEASIGATQVHIQGIMAEPLKLSGVDLQMELSGPDLAAAFPVFGVPLPPSRDYSISGRLIRDGPNWTFRGLDGRVGESDLQGGLSVITGGERPIFRANLTSHRLALADLAGFIGARPDAPKSRDNKVLPDNPVNVERLRAMDMDVTFRGQRVEAPGLPMDGLDAHLVIENGLARLDPLAFTIAKGSFAGLVELDGRQTVPRTRLDMSISRMELHSFFAGTRFASETSGTLAGKLQLAGSGRSTAEILAGADGRVTLLMAGGSFSALLIEAAGIDVAEALGFALGKDKSVPVRCLVADFQLNQGMAQSRALVLDTTDSAITGGGTIDLGSEAMNLKLEAHPKDPSPFSARSPVVVRGTLAKPDVVLDTTTQAARGGLAVALGALLTPLVALVPFLEPGLGEDQNCPGLINQAQAR